MKVPRRGKYEIFSATHVALPVSIGEDLEGCWYKLYARSPVGRYW